ncbi:MAG TPA: homoserine kinase [Candidatus Binatia bacterium]|nr:homoserine kinase [Candidatus Binatia bacterium]
MAVFRQLDVPAARTLGRLFGVEVVGATPLARGSVNSNFRLALADGRAVFARVYEEQDERGAAWETALVTHLAHAGVPTPPALARVDGRGRVATLGAGAAARPVALFAWSGGEVLCQASVRPRVAWDVGAALARVHRAAARFADGRPGRFGVAELRTRCATIARATDPELLAVAPVLDAELAAAAAARTPGLPGGVVHGDLFRDNVLWRDGRVVALLDFESAGAETWAYDLMVTVLAWCFGAALDESLVHALLAGYQSERPLAPAETAALATEARFAALRFTVTRITDFALRPASAAGRTKDWRRFRARLAALEALGPARLSRLASTPLTRPPA